MAYTLNVLKRVAILGGVVALGGAAYFTRKLQSNFRKEEYYKLSLDILNGYEPGVKLLGKPITTKDLELGKTGENFSDGLNAKLSIPLKGRKKSGNLISWSSRKVSTESWKVDKLDLSIEGKQWTFYINPKSKTLYATTQSQEDSVMLAQQSVEEEVPEKTGES